MASCDALTSFKPARARYSWVHARGPASTGWSRCTRGAPSHRGHNGHWLHIWRQRRLGLWTADHLRRRFRYRLALGLEHPHSQARLRGRLGAAAALALHKANRAAACAPRLARRTTQEPAPQSSAQHERSWPRAVRLCNASQPSSQVASRNIAPTKSTGRPCNITSTYLMAYCCGKIDCKR